MCLCLLFVFVMWTLMLLLSSNVAMMVTTCDIKLDCHEFYGFPTISSSPPSKLAGLNVTLHSEGGSDILNISWAINIDASICYLTGTLIQISGQPDHICEYRPLFSKCDDLVGEQIWFHYAVETSYGFTRVTVSNLPLAEPGSDFVHMSTSFDIPRRVQPTVRPRTPQVTTETGNVFIPEIISEPTVPGMTATDVLVIFLGGSVGLMILSSCYLIYKRSGLSIATSVSFRKLPKSAVVPTPVLVVYPAENAAFHRAVVELAEFLQWHASCSVAIDMWQQEKIAELGPMRWLAEQANGADRVLIVCPQPSSECNRYPPKSPSFPVPCVPAAAHDLYPLILNMVASHAKSASELDKFWVVELGERQVKRPYAFPLELTACKTFCLMKDLNKLCKSLCAQWKGGKMSDVLFRPEFSYSEKNTVKLREAVEKLSGHQTSISSEKQPLKSAVIYV